MTKAELVAAMADRAGLNRAQAKEALDAFIASVSTSLKDGKEVRLVGFGSFVPVKRAAGTARNPRTGETVEAARLADLPLPRGGRAEKHPERLIAVRLEESRAAAASRPLFSFGAGGDLRYLAAVFGE